MLTIIIVLAVLFAILVPALIHIEMKANEEDPKYMRIRDIILEATSPK